MSQGGTHRENTRWLQHRAGAYFRGRITPPRINSMSEGPTTTKSVERTGKMSPDADPWRYRCPKGHSSWMSLAESDEYKCKLCGVRFLEEDLLDIRAEDTSVTNFEVPTNPNIGILVCTRHVPFYSDCLTASMSKLVLQNRKDRDQFNCQI